MDVLTFREITEDGNIFVDSCREILVKKKFGINRVVAKFVPWSMRQDQIDNRVISCRELFDHKNGHKRRSQSKLLHAMKHGLTFSMMIKKSNRHSGQKISILIRSW